MAVTQTTRNVVRPAAYRIVVAAGTTTASAWRRATVRRDVLREEPVRYKRCAEGSVTVYRPVV